ncbi:MAG: hypothetical protein J6Y29_02855 [Clostridiales bacterium]|nr:hypothetical protein [Clostridiales bacterium]
MKKLVKNFDLLQESGLHDYLMEYFLVDGSHAEFVAKEPHGIETLKLQFENVEEFFLNGDGGGIFGSKSGVRVNVVSIIFDIKIEKLDNNTIQTKIGTSRGVYVYIVSGKLTVTKI